jgi:signal transduction histidine kinase
MGDPAHAGERRRFVDVSPAAIALVVIIVADVLVGIITYYRLQSNRSVIVTVFQAREDLQALLTLVIDQETAVRAVDATGGSYPQFFDPYMSAEAQYPYVLQSLHAELQTPQVAAAHRYVDDADRLHARWLASVAHPIIASPATPQAVNLEIRGKQIVDRIRSDLARAQAITESAAVTAEQAASTYVLLAISIIVLFVIAAGAIALWIERQQTLERRRFRQQIQERNAALERSNAALQEFAYVASHDLQEPLRTVASFTQLLQKRYAGKLDATADEFIGFAVEGAQRMQRLIQDILLYSRVTTTGKPLQPTDLNAPARRAVENLKVAIEERGARVEVEPLPAVMGDDVQLTQLLQNLIGNALKYAAAQPRVLVQADQNGEAWRICVKDNGIGIAPEYHQRIFRIFQRLHTRSEYGGTGIGLAICKSIVDRHGGRIWVESEAGKGSTFCFTLSPVPKENAHLA